MIKKVVRELMQHRGTASAKGVINVQSQTNYFFRHYVSIFKIIHTNFYDR